MKCSSPREAVLYGWLSCTHAGRVIVPDSAAKLVAVEIAGHAFARLLSFWESPFKRLIISPCGCGILREPSVQWRSAAVWFGGEIAASMF